MLRKGLGKGMTGFSRFVVYAKLLCSEKPLSQSYYRVLVIILYIIALVKGVGEKTIKCLENNGFFAMNGISAK